MMWIVQIALLTIACAMSGAYLTTLIRTFGFMQRFVTVKPLGCNVCMSFHSNALVLISLAAAGVIEWFGLFLVLPAAYMTLKMLNDQKHQKASEDFPMPGGDDA